MSNTPFPLARYRDSNHLELKPNRDGWGDGLLQLGEAHDDVVVLSADLAESTRLLPFAKSFPDRFFELGVAEQNLASVAAGLALSGLRPCISTYASFSPTRNYEQIRVSIAYTNVPVIIAGHYAGLVTGPDGATHQALEDIGLMRMLPNFSVICPADAIEAAKAVQAAYQLRQPVYLRFSREPTPCLTTPKSPFSIGTAYLVRPGQGLTIISTGHLLFEALKAGDELNAQVIHLPTIKPLDLDTILQCVRHTSRVITLEDHQTAGGMGSAVCEMLSQQYPVPVIRMGVQDKFGQSATASQLLSTYQITWQDVIRIALDTSAWPKSTSTF